MAVTIVSCYFLPFIFYFFAQIVFPKSIAAPIFGIAALSVSSLILYFQMLDARKVTVVIQKEPVVVPASQKITLQETSPIVDFAKASLHCPQVIAVKKQHPAENTLLEVQAVLHAMQKDLISQKNLFHDELEKKAVTLDELKKALEKAEIALSEKDAELEVRAKELADLKFEMYTLLRIESYVDHTCTSKLATASF